MAAAALSPLWSLVSLAEAQTTTPGSRALPPVPNVSALLRNVPGTHSSATFLNGLGQLAVPAGSGNVSGPGSSTNGFIPQWSGTGGTALSTGLAVGNSGNSTVLETDGSGHIPSTTIVNVVTGPGSSTDGNVARWSGASGQILSTGTPVGNSGANNIMQADSGGKLDRSVVPMPLNTTDTGHFEYSGTTPSPAGNCGGSPSVGGNDVVGRITLGTAPGSTFCQLTFATTWVNTPICQVWNETNSLPARDVFPQPSTTVLAIVNKSGVNLTAGDNIAYSCVGYR